MSRLNQQNSLNYGNKETHIFTEFGTLNKESTQKEVLEAIKNINLNVGEIVVGDITVESSDTITHDKLDTLNTTLTNKHLSSSTDTVGVSGSVSITGTPSVSISGTPAVSISGTPAVSISGTPAVTISGTPSVSANISNASIAVTGDFYPTTQPVSGTVSISNDIIVVEPINTSINDAPFDLMINGPTLWADSLPTGTPFFADPNGREGWYYDNFSNIANKSNIYWYANPISGDFQENDMTFAQLSGMYCIITCDYVENGSLTIPTMGVFSQPTGTNDFLPGFAHSRWVYQLSTTNLAKLRKGETILLYTGATRPDVYLTMPAYPLVLASQNGDALSSEIIAYMTVNTQATTSKIGYLLQFVGYLNSAIGFNREYQFKNSKNRVIQNNQYSGSISVSNFPASQTISGSVSITGTPSVNISNSSIAVTGAFYPETQPISGSVGITGTPSVNANISNASIAVTGTFYPETQPISGSVGITGSPTVTVGNSSIAVTGAFYPETQPISGSVGITGTPSVNANISNSSIAVTGAFYPETQPISGSVGITGSPTVTVGNSSIAVTGAFYPETQPISGSVGITGTPSVNANISNSSIAVTGAFYPETQPISGNVGITGSPTVTVGNSSIAVTGAFYPETQPISGSVGITGSPTVTVGNSSIAVTGAFYPETQPISGSVGITGSPTVTVGNSSIAVTGAFYPETQPISGSVSLDTSGNTIKIDQTGTNNAVSFASGSTVGLATSANTIKIDSANNAISGTVTIQGSDYTTPETLNKVYVDANGFITANSLTTQHENILLGYTFYKNQLTILSTNSQFMVPEVPTSANMPSFNNNGWCYRNVITANACNGSLLWYNNGDYGTIQTYPTQTDIEVRDLDIFYVIIQNYYPATQSKIQMNIYTKNQGAGDYSVNYRSKFNYTVSGSPYIAMGQSYMIYNGLLARVKTNDPEVPRVLYALNTGNSQGPLANTEVISHIELLFTSSGGDTFLANIVEGGVYSKNGHLVNYYFDNDLRAKNEFINISVNSVLGNLTFEGSDLQTISKISNGTNTADVLSALSNVSSANGLVCNSILKGWNTTSGNIDPLTCVLNGDKNQLEVRDNDAVAELTSIDNKTVQQYDTTNTKIGGYNITGLNVYQILPKIRSFAMSGTNPNGSVSDTLLGGAGTTLRVDTTSFGYANQKTFYAFIPTGSTLRTLSYTFINSSGVESSTATAITATNTYQSLFTGSGINELKFNGNVNPGANDLVYITINTSSNVNNVASLNIRNHYCGVFTCPSNAIAQVVSIDYNMATAGDQLFMNIFGADGNRSVVYSGYFYQTGVNNFHASESGIGRIIQPLETVCFSSWSTSTVNKYLYYTVLVKYF